MTSTHTSYSESTAPLWGVGGAEITRRTNHESRNATDINRDNLLQQQVN